VVIINQSLFNFEDTKQCTACKQSYPSYFFIKNTATCKNCKKLRNKAYRDRLKQATPPWITFKMLQQIEQFKLLASEMSCENVSYEIDHIYSLKGENSSGLNVPWNIQIVSSTENKQKKNKNGFINEVLSWEMRTS